MFHSPMDPLQRSYVPGDAVVRIMTAEHLIEAFGLLLDRQVCAINFCDCGHVLRRSVVTVRQRERLTFDTSDEIIILSSADQFFPQRLFSPSSAFIHPS
jgi:hypothetical protein